jgi:hypothetical protein
MDNRLGYRLMRREWNAPYDPTFTNSSEDMAELKRIVKEACIEVSVIFDSEEDKELFEKTHDINLIRYFLEAKGK